MTRTSGARSAEDVHPDARRLAEAYERTLSGEPARRGPRALIGESWRRARAHGLDPDCAPPPRRLPKDELEWRRQAPGLAAVLPVLREGLLAAAESAQHIMVVCDADGVVLWREGCAAVLRGADRIDLELGVDWTERRKGTNGIGTSLVARRPVLVHTREHFVRDHHPWVCASAPLTDPRNGRLLGLVDVSGPMRTMSSVSLALVSAVTRVAEGELRDSHWAALERLRAVAAPVMARIGGRALAVDDDGWPAAATGMAPPERVRLPKSPSAGDCRLPGLGPCSLEPLPGGGWLVRVKPEDQAPPPVRLVLDLTRPAAASLWVDSAAGPWSQQLSPRHAELLYLLAVHPDGLSATALAYALFGDTSRAVTVRAELSRLRRKFAGLLAHRPYRFCDGVEIQLRVPDKPLDLLPHSTAPGVLAARRA